MKKIKNGALLLINFISVTIYGSQSLHEQYPLHQSVINTFISDSIVFTPQQHLKKITFGYLGETPAKQLREIQDSCQAYTNILNQLTTLRKEIFVANTQQQIDSIVSSVAKIIDENYQLYKKNKK